MRMFFFAVLMILINFRGLAQTRTIYYNSQWEIVSKEIASYYRVCQIGGGVGKNFFTGPVEDYLMNGKILMKGAYSPYGLKTGDFIFYYPSGQIQLQGKFENGWRKGIWKHFFENGKLEHEVNFPAPERWGTIPDFKPITAYDSSGALILENGTGHWHYEYEWHGMAERYIVEGEFKNGWKDGSWKCTLSNGQTLYHETYKNGKFKTGSVTDGERVEKLTQPVDNKFMLPYKLEITENFVYQRGTTLDIYPYLNFLPAKLGPSETTSIIARDTIPDEEKIFLLVEQQAEFPGGMVAMMKFIEQNQIYPKSALRMGVEGNIYVQFIVERDGSISTIRIVKGINADLDKEAIRIVSIFPKWKPGMQNGKVVKSQFVVPVRFKLD